MTSKSSAEPGALVVTAPIVGMHFRPPARQLLGVLRPGAKLLLEPEPDNPYDEKAIKVLVNVAEEVQPWQYPKLADVLIGTGLEPEDLLERTEPLQLGYIADSDGKMQRKTGGPGNREVGELMRRGPVTATVQFDPSGMPFARVEAKGPEL